MIINLPENHYKALKYLRQLIFFKLFVLILKFKHGFRHTTTEWLQGLS